MNISEEMILKMNNLTSNVGKAYKDALEQNHPKKYGTFAAQSEKMFKYMASAEKDELLDLTPDENMQSLIEKKELAEIKRDKILEQYVPKDKLKDFNKMSQTKKLEYIKSQIPHEPNRDSEAHIIAEIVLTKLNQLNEEIKHLDKSIITLELEKMRDEQIKAIEEQEKNSKELEPISNSIPEEPPTFQ